MVKNALNIQYSRQEYDDWLYEQTYDFDVEGPPGSVVTLISGDPDDEYYGSVFYYRTNQKNEYLNFTILNNGVKIAICDGGKEDSPGRVFASKTVQYSTDKENWTSISSVSGGTVYTRAFNEGDVVYFKGNNARLSEPSGNSWTTSLMFNTTGGNVKIAGNLKSILSGDTFFNNDAAPYPDRGFRKLFQGCTGLTDASRLYISSGANTYQGFYLTFADCSNLVYPPKLPSMTLAGACYYSMFKNCPKLAYAPELPATTLQSYCYGSMFEGCTSLTKAPNLPATDVQSHCYEYMFKNCSHLSYIDWGGRNAVNESSSCVGWATGVSGSGVFNFSNAVPPPGYATGVNGVPTGWNISQLHL